MNAKELAAHLSAAVDVPHSGEEVAKGRFALVPLGFQPGDASYTVRVEHEGLRYGVIIEASPFSGKLLGSLVDRIAARPELRDDIAAGLARIAWDLRVSPVEGSRILFEAREANAALLTDDVTRTTRVVEACVSLSRFMLGSLAITHTPAHTRPARRRDEATAEHVSWLYDPAERDRATATHKRLENWLLDRVGREGIQPLDSQGGVEFDLAWIEHDGSLTLCEVKSTSGHEDHQIRLGLGQVLHYAAHMRAGWPRMVNPLLFVEDEPRDAVWLSICDEHGVILAWPAAWDQIRAPSDARPPDGMEKP